MSLRAASEPPVCRRTTGGDQVYVVSKDAWHETQRRLAALEAKTSATGRIFSRLEEIDEYLEIARERVELLRESRMRTDRALRMLKMTLSEKASSDGDILTTLLQALALWEEENRGQRLRDEEEARKREEIRKLSAEHDKRA